VKVVAGRGGNGAVAFRREKFVPFGGPSGGDGGRGGDVIFETDEGLSTLLDFAHVHALKAKDGENGMGSDCYGRGGADLVCRVPVGTQIFDEASGELLFDLAEPTMRVVVAHGGRGGRGNIHFATPEDRAPRRAEPGGLGQERDLRLELKVMADVGLLGFPNVGKSTFIRAVSRARPKVADYPFTTLEPHLGMVRVDDEKAFVIADIPGLIPGAADGAGLGIRFLKHVERTRALLHIVTVDPAEGREPWEDYLALTRELEAFDPELAKRPTLVVMSKADLPEVREAFERAKPIFAKAKRPLHLVSAATGEGVQRLVYDLLGLVERGRKGVTLSEDDLEEPTTERKPRRPVEATPATRATPREEVDAPAKEPARQAPAAKKSDSKPAAKKPAAKKPAAKKSDSKPAAKKHAKKAAAKAATKKSGERRTRQPAAKKSAKKATQRPVRRNGAKKGAKAQAARGKPAAKPRKKAKARR